MKSLVFNIVFLIGLILSVEAQEQKPKKEHLRKIVPEQKNYKIDTSFHVKGNCNLKKHQTVPIEIPNVYDKRGEDMSSPMPIAKLSGKGLAPMPGTEKLDKNESKK